jgi:hypothetical protein
MSLAMFKSVIGGVARERFAQTAASATLSSIDFTAYNWPTSWEMLSLCHFDLIELREKRSAGMYVMMRFMYNWWLFTLTCCCVNLLTSVSMAIAAAGARGYAGVNILFSIMWLLVLAVLGMLFVYKTYHGVAMPSSVSLLVSKVRAPRRAFRAARGCAPSSTPHARARPLPARPGTLCRHVHPMPAAVPGLVRQHQRLDGSRRQALYTRHCRRRARVSRLLLGGHDHHRVPSLVRELGCARLRCVSCVHWAATR